MHYQLFTTAAILAALVPLVPAAIMAPTLERRATWETTKNDIDLSQLGTIELESQNPNPSKMALRSLEARSSASAFVCRARTPLPRSGGKWLYHEATCDRTGTDVNTFKVTCAAENMHADLNYRNPGKCGKNQWCVEFHGYNEIGQGAWDVTCIDRPQIHTWVANTFSNPGAITTCSSGWSNHGKNNLKATFEVDVMDAGAVNRVAPAEVFFQLNQKRIGVSRRNDPDVGSGSIIIPPGGSIQACVTAIQGQTLNLLGALTSLISV